VITYRTARTRDDIMADTGQRGLEFWIKSGWMDFTAIAFIGVVFLCVGIAVHNAPPPSPPTQVELEAQAQQRQAQQLAYERRVEDARKAAAARGARASWLCRISRSCEKYASVRQDCAVAGDFDNCLRVKMGSDMNDTMYCTNDGHITYPPDDMPSKVECLGVRRQSF
jgi:hypothetical protein